MTSAGSDVAKAGWLYRESSVLHRWKKNWFVLYTDGLLRYFESQSQDSSRAEEVFILRTVCQCVKTGSEVKSTSPPDDVRGGKSCMFQLEMRDGNHLLLCAETDDDMKAWQYSLEEARAMAPLGGPMVAGPSAVPVGFAYQRVAGGGYPGQVINSPPPQVVQTQQGMTTIINQAPPMMVMDDNRRRCGGFANRHHCKPGTVYVTTARFW